MRIPARLLSISDVDIFADVDHRDTREDHLDLDGLIGAESPATRGRWRARSAGVTAEAEQARVHGAYALPHVATACGAGLPEPRPLPSSAIQVEMSRQTAACSEVRAPRRATRLSPSAQGHRPSPMPNRDGYGSIVVSPSRAPYLLKTSAINASDTALMHILQFAVIARATRSTIMTSLLPVAQRRASRRNSPDASSSRAITRHLRRCQS